MKRIKKQLKNEELLKLVTGVMTTIIVFIGLPFAAYLFMGFVDWLCSDPLSLINHMPN